MIKNWGGEEYLVVGNYTPLQVLHEKYKDVECPTTEAWLS